MEDALRLAQEADLDLVEVAPDARPPVCKLMDFGKFKYEADMKAREARRNQTNTILKEIRFRLKIDPHDYGTKKGHVERFLTAGDKVKVMIMFRGREQSRPEMGMRLLQRLAADVAELGFVESQPKQDGRNMIMVLGPVKKKADQKSEARRAAQREAALAENEAKAASKAAGATEAPATEDAPAIAVEESAPAASSTPAATAPVEAPTSETAAEQARSSEAGRAPAPLDDAPAPLDEAPVAPVDEAPVADEAPAVAEQTAAPKAAPKPTATPKPVPVKKVAAPRPAPAKKPATRASAKDA